MNDFVYFTKSERIGITVFFSCLLLLFGGLHIWRTHRVKTYESEDLLLEAIHKDSTIITTTNYPTRANTLPPKPVNPNNATKPQLLAIGFSNYAATNLINYREKGATFYRLEDINKVYGMDSIILSKVSPWLKFDDYVDNTDRRSDSPTKQKHTDVEPRPTTVIDPNTATETELVEFGLNKFTAMNLIKYRKKGALFIQLSDLYSVYGVDSNYINKHSEFLAFPSASIPSLSNPDSLSNSKTIKEVASIDPNVASQDELEAIGLPIRTAKTLITFRNSGARFYDKQDMLKVYGVTDSIYALIESYLLFEKSENYKTKVENISIIYELNNVTSEELIKIKGIGEYLSKAIIEYRDKLGGYRNTSQLSEVPGLRKETYDKVKSLFTANGEIQTFHPLSLEFKELLQHPYVDYETAKTLKALSVHDYKERIKELIDSGNIDTRLIPYLIQ